MIETSNEATGPDFGGVVQSAKTTRKLPLSQTQVPPAARSLGALGAIPFVILALAGPFLEASFQERAHFALAAYGAVILSFLGGIHWGLAIAGASPAERRGITFARLGASVIPSLVGWGALLLSGPVGTLVLAASFSGLILFDWHVSRKAQTPAWYPKLRWPLTIVVVASLSLAAFA